MTGMLSVLISVVCFLCTGRSRDITFVGEEKNLETLCEVVHVAKLNPVPS